jgi:hypothetical protein
MNRIIISQGKIGLVFKRGSYLKVLYQGTYWISAGKRVFLYDLTKQFIPPVELNILLNDEELVNKLHVVEVMDNEITLVYRNGVFEQVLTAGRYTFWKGIIDYRFVKADLGKIEITEPIDKNILQRSEMLQFIRVFSIEPSQKALLYVDGKYERTIETGDFYFWKNATKIHIAKVDLRQQQLEISGQEMLTRDKAALRVNFYTQYKVVDIIKAINENKEYEKQLYILMQLALREFIGTLTLDEILEKKDSISKYVMESLKEKTANLGVEIKGCGIRDIILPGEVKDIMNQVLVAEKKAQANTITRREETASTRSLLNTAKLMEENEMLFKLKEMEYVEKISDKINSISLSGGNQVLNQLKEIFSTCK